MPLATTRPIMIQAMALQIVRFRSGSPIPSSSVENSFKISILEKKIRVDLELNPKILSGYVK